MSHTNRVRLRLEELDPRIAPSATPVSLAAEQAHENIVAIVQHDTSAESAHASDKTEDGATASKTDGEEAKSAEELLAEQRAEETENLHTLFEWYEKTEKAHVNQEKALEAYVEFHLEANAEELKEKTNHAKYHPHDHQHYPHGHAHIEQEYKLAEPEENEFGAKFDPDTRTITYAYRSHGRLTAEFSTLSGEKGIRKTGHGAVEVSADVSYVNVIVKDNEGHVVMEGTLTTNGEKSAFHQKKPLHHEAESHKEHVSPKHAAPGHKIDLRQKPHRSQPPTDVSYLWQRKADYSPASWEPTDEAVEMHGVHVGTEAGGRTEAAPAVMATTAASVAFLFAGAQEKKKPSSHETIALYDTTSEALKTTVTGTKRPKGRRAFPKAVLGFLQNPFGWRKGR